MNINGAQLHLIINHFPVVGFPLVFLALTWGLWRKDNQVFVFGAYLTILIMISTLVSYFTGEGAEDTIRSIEGFNIDLVHNHEDTALIAMIFSGILGAMALMCLPLIQRKIPVLKNPNFERKIRFALTIGVIILSLILAYLAHQGGLIRHSEIR